MKKFATAFLVAAAAAVAVPAPALAAGTGLCSKNCNLAKKRLPSKTPEKGPVIGRVFIPPVIGRVFEPPVIGRVFPGTPVPKAQSRNRRR